MPRNLEVITTVPVSLAWRRPANIPEEVLINYRITLTSDLNSERNTSFVTDQAQLSIQFLELALADEGQCVAVTFSVVAIAAGTEDSVAAVVMDTLPLCECHV